MSRPTEMSLKIDEVAQRNLSDSPNLLVRLARSHNRDCITPEDISESLSRFVADNDTAMIIHEDETVKDFLEILSRQVDGIGVEDVGLCAFVLWKELYAN